MRISLLLLITLCLPPQVVWGQDADAMPSGIDESVARLVDAFNRHAADEVVAAWQADAVHWSDAEQRGFAGRDELEKVYQAFFQEFPEAKLSIQVQSHNAQSPEKVTIEGSATVTRQSGDETSSQFLATLEKQDGAWLIEQSRETPLDPPGSRLPRLAWLIGHWQDSDGGVTNEFKWAMNEKFLQRTFRLEKDGEVLHQGQQIIGWDEEDGCIRSWTFDGTGSFGEGVWRADGEARWIVTIVGKLPDGRRGSMKQVLERTDENSLTIQTFDADSEGESQPNSAAVTLKRRSASND